MKLAAVAFGAGLLFAIGLGAGGMTQPGKVIAFLDFFGPWDPSLMLVMASAVLVYLPAFLLARRRGRSALGASLALPTRRDIDPRLVLGSTLFGAGWGLGGFCPGPALVGAGAGLESAAIVVAGMVVGMFAYNAIEDWLGQLRRDREGRGMAGEARGSRPSIAAPIGETR